jgi:hypothetical protein
MPFEGREAGEQPRDIISAAEGLSPSPGHGPRSHGAEEVSDVDIDDLGLTDVRQCIAD